MIDDKIIKAAEIYGHFNSTHEVYGVLKEEVDEFFDVVQRKGLDSQKTFELEHHRTYHRSALESKTNDMIQELEDIAAVAQRAIKELELGQIKWV